MKESIGGTWLFTIVVVFLALFTTFVSVTTNYARSFKIKDDILDKITQYKGINEESIPRIKEHLRGVGYSSTGTCPSDGELWFGFSITDSSNSPASYGPNGANGTNFCVKRITVSCGGEQVNGMMQGRIDSFPSAYYSVVVFFSLDWPIIRQVFNIKIAGETPVITHPKDINEINSKVGCGS